MGLRVIKRTKDEEPFSEGRVALAVAKAFMAASGEGERAALGREMGMEIAKEVEKKGQEAFQEGRLPLEWIQDQIEGMLSAKGKAQEAKAFGAYRKERSALREKRSLAALKKELRIRRGKREERWGEEEVGAFLAKAAQGLSRLSLREAQKNARWEEFPKGKDIGEFCAFLAQNILAGIKGGERQELELAKRLELERWALEATGRAPALDGFEAADLALRKEARIAVDKWATAGALKEKSAAPWALELIDELSWRDAWGLGFRGILALRDAMPRLPQNQAPEPPSLSLWRQAVEFSAEPERAKELLAALKSKKIMLPMGTVKNACFAGKPLGTEWALGVGDSVEGVFSALKEASELAKQGCGIAANLSAVRAKGSLVGREGVSHGVGPVARLFAASCEMLGSASRIRLFMEPWHADLKEFLDLAKSGQLNARSCVLIPDEMMARAFTGKKWPLLSPSENPKLGESWGLEFKRELERSEEEIKAGRMKGTLVEAKDALGWIAEAIAIGGAPSVAFKDALGAMGPACAPRIPNSRLAASMPAPVGGKSSLPEVCVGLSGIETAQELERICLLALEMADDMLEEEGNSKEAKAWRCVALGAVGSGPAQEEFFACARRSAQKIGQERGAFERIGESHWKTIEPMEERRKELLALRGGYLEGGPLALPSAQNSRFAGIVSLSPREEYIWLTDEAPAFVSDSGLGGFQVRYQGKTHWVGDAAPKERESARAQLEKAASAQRGADQALTLDIKMESGGSQAIEEALKTAWVKGLGSIRRFGLPREKEGREKIARGGAGA